MENNLAGLRAALTDPRWGVLPPERCVSLSDQTDLPHVFETISNYAQAAQDTLLVYFAGHGIPDRGSELFLSLVKTEPDAPTFTALPLAMLRKALKDSRAVRKILVIDCCFSGRALSDIDLAALSRLEVSGTYTLTSVAANERALAPEGATYTVFTGELLTLLTDGIPEGPQLLDLNTVYQKLLTVMKGRDLPLPRQANTDTAGQLVLGRNPAHHHGEGQHSGEFGQVTRAEQVELTLLCRQLTPTQVFDLYQRAVGPWGPPLDSGVSDTATVVQHLAQLLLKPNNIPPVVEFATWAAQFMAGSAGHGPLNRWVDLVADRLGLGANSIARLRHVVREKAAEQPQEHYLVVQLDSHPVLRDRYRLSVRLHCGSQDGQPQSCGDQDQPLRLEEIRELVVRLLPGFVRAVDAARVTIEFLVPRELIDQDYDQWVLQSQDLLGVLYTVVVCDLDRPGRGQPDPQWRTKWSLLQNAAKPAGALGVYWVDPAAATQSAALRAGLLRQRENWVCLALSSRPVIGTAGQLLAAGTDLGAPAAIWQRGTSTTATSTVTVKEILARGPLALLPAQVLDLRREAVEKMDDGHCGRNLSLLWDDPSRFPKPGQALDAPAVTQ